VEKNPADGSSNLPRATYREPQTGIQDSSILTVLIHLHNKGFAETTIKGTAKKLRLLSRHADLKDPEGVVRYIASLANNNTKSLLVAAYRHYARFHGIAWEKPIYAKTENPIKCPLEENLDTIIKAARSLKRKVAFNIVKDTGIRPIELHALTLENMDLEQGVIHIRSAKKGNPRSLKLKSGTHADLKLLIASLRRGLKDRVFANPERLGIYWCEERTRAYGETGNVELLKIRLYGHTIRTQTP